MYSDLLIHYTRQYVRRLYMDTLACAHESPDLAAAAAMTAGAGAGTAGAGAGGAGQGQSAQSSHSHSPHGQYHASPELCSGVALAYGAAKQNLTGVPPWPVNPYGPIPGNTYILPGMGNKVEAYT